VNFRNEVALRLGLGHQWVSIRINISADLSEFLYPPHRTILPLLQSEAISYSLPGFRYAPPWANVYRHSVARIRAPRSVFSS
jgi:hypothetical protein